MSQPTTYYGATHAGSSVLLLARIEKADGALIDPGEVASASYTVYRLRPCEVPDRVAIDGHDAAALAPGGVLFATPQTAAPWTGDAIGYNFRHEIDVTSSPAFPEPNDRYQVRYTLRLSVGQPIVFTFEIEAI